MAQDSFSLINDIRDILQAAKSLGKTTFVNIDELNEKLDDLQIHLEQDLYQSRIIVTDREQILSNSRAEAAQMLHDAREKADELVSMSNVYTEAVEKAKETEAKAAENAQFILNEAQAQADRMIGEANDSINAKQIAITNYINTSLRNADAVLDNARQYLADSVSRIDFSKGEIDGLTEKLSGFTGYENLQINNQ